MMVCNRCGKENQDHYKFCLGCGAELVARSGEIATMKTMMAEAPASSRPSSQGFAAHGSSSALPGMPPLSQFPTAGPPPGVPSGVHQAAPTAARRCPACGTDVPPAFRFCGGCGNRMEEVAAAASPARATPAVVEPPRPQPKPQPKASMTLIRPDGSEGGTHDLRQGENKIGRSFGTIFEGDGYLSPTHAELIISGATALVRDLDSLNGVFVKMTDEEEILPGQIIRVGQELIRYDIIQPAEAMPDGTEVMGSPNPGFWGKLTIIVGREVDGAAYPLLGETVTMGRERGEINFPDDGYVSGLHARVSLRDGRVYLNDLGSSNGTFVKVNGERKVKNDSFVLLGQQLFRLNLTAA